MQLVTLAENWAREMAEDCRAAQTSITISALSMQPPRHPSPLPWGSLWQSWIAAAARGVRVTAFLAAPSAAHPATLQNSNAATFAHKHGLAVRFVPQPNLLHAKSCIVDSRLCWIGSGNMTAAAAHHNHELYVRFEAEQIAQRIEARFDAIANHV